MEIYLFCLCTDRAFCYPSNKYLSDFLDVQNVAAGRTGDGNVADVKPGDESEAGVTC